jgi:TonB family protein
MRLSFIISLIFHGFLFSALFVEWHAASRMHLPEKVYSVKVLGSLRTGTVRSAPGRRESVKVTAPKTAPKKKLPREMGPKVAVPKKQAKNRKPKGSSEVPAPAAAAREQARGDSTGTGAGTSGAEGITVDAAQFPFGYFLSAIERRVSESWYLAMVKPGSGLTCVVYFRLMRNGSVEDVRVEKGSGNDYFDRSAVRAVKSASPFPPLPRGFQDDFLGIHFTFVQKE